MCIFLDRSCSAAERVLSADWGGSYSCVTQAINRRYQAKQFVNIWIFFSRLIGKGQRKCKKKDRKGNQMFWQFSVSRNRALMPVFIAISQRKPDRFMTM